MARSRARTQFLDPRKKFDLVYFLKLVFLATLYYEFERNKEMQLAFIQYRFLYFTPILYLHVTV